ncbi:carboxymuconolactone decarboxylase family protein [Kaistia terrae]|uniref:Carboxymuconolactone decarboxylase family protein n=1 Tax=Kaistia terrae TaxID=537017 RepID=A0ABW0PPB5_9HYPH|nr:carboxymuconolactone decarboxylase family protein [Kaistia terrae]MCX5577730.1 carboxymuconolactone decarboxylase family protein [Kaistia terrae]
MKARLDDHLNKAPAAIKAIMALEAALRTSTLETTLLELVKLRASQINGCAYCIHLHATSLRKSGESEMRLYLLDAWREAPHYTARERAALGWTETLTRLSEADVDEAEYEILEAAFTPQEQVNLTLAIGAINLWNRLQVGFAVPPPFPEGAYDA